MKSKLETLKKALKKRDLLYKIICYALMKLGFSNTELQVLEIRNKRYNKLQKKYNSALSTINYSPSAVTGSVNPHVWICWFQGVDNAPEIVKKCIESVYRYFDDKEIHIITEENMYNFVTIPDYVIQKKNQGIIGYAHFSDILRTELLIRHGGMWIDATTFLTGRIPDYVYRKPLFMLHTKNRMDVAVCKNSWFIYATADNRILKTVRDLLYAYWKKENYLGEYFLWHLFVKMSFSKYPEDLIEMDYVSEEMSHWLSYNIFKSYDPVYWEQIKRHSSIHKLSYHILKVPDDISGTYYERLMSRRLE